MGFVKIKARETLSLKHWISIQRSGITFCAEFVRDEKLTDMETCAFFQDENNAFRFGVEFYEDKSGQYTLNKNTRDGYPSHGRTTKGNSFTSLFPVLEKLKKSSDKSLQRRFAISKDLSTGMYCWEVRPNFERKGTPDKLPSNVVGIYRYTNIVGDVTYIGSGNIKERYRDHVQEGITEDLDFIEYSVVEDGSEVELERQHYLEFKARYGVKPRDNKITPPSTDSKVSK